MPLSEREQQILDEIEKNLYEEDPEFARGARPRSRSDAVRRLRRGLTTFGVGLAVLMGFFVSQSIPLGVVAFGAMVAGIVLMAGSASTLVTRRSSEPGVRARVTGAIARIEKRIRDRYKRI